ncbi:MAG: NADP-reducing hydrogenase subunit HndC [Firmicutes bacterium ADurb.Bin182]|nr:MAG: NADP-reducing hydrogenase subunit HndC [Firmicutes bacterium ADurb.Bin182]
MEEMRVILNKAGEISPVSTKEYIDIGGYQGLKKALEAPENIIGVIKASGLRGRGGAGFPAGLKLSFTADTTADRKYIVCNADEGEPETIKDRMIMDLVPHRLFEGMAIAGIAVGADKGFIYLRAEYPYVAKTLERALADARENGCLGKNIMGSGKDFDIEIRTGAGAYICGEETALLSSIEGKRGEPRFKPPFPGVAGLWGKPTVLNNVETLANFPAILVNGAEWFRTLGTEKCPGTKLFTLSGNIAKPGVYEFPIGVTIRSLYEEAGGGCPGGKRLIAVQTGGASGNIIPASLIDTLMDIESCAAAGATFGTGDLMFMDEDCDILDVLENLTEFFAEESCGKCTPCREGTPRMLEFIGKFKNGTAKEGDLELMLELGSLMVEGSLCGLGQASPNPIFSAVRFFPEIFALKTDSKRGSC